MFNIFKAIPIAIEKVYEKNNHKYPKWMVWVIGIITLPMVLVLLLSIEVEYFFKRFKS